MYRPAEETGEVRALSHTPPRPPGFGDPKRDAWRSWEMGKKRRARLKVQPPIAVSKCTDRVREWYSSQSSDKGGQGKCGEGVCSSVDERW